MCIRDSHWSFPSQNIVYADTSDAIAYVMPGLVPRRRKGDGLTPVPGWNDDFGWDGFIPVSYTHLDVYKRQVLMTPTSPVLPFRLGERMSDPMTMRRARAKARS